MSSWFSTVFLGYFCSGPKTPRNAKIKDKNGQNQHSPKKTHRQTDIATYRLNRPRRQSGKKTFF